MSNFIKESPSFFCPYLGNIHKILMKNSAANVEIKIAHRVAQGVHAHTM